MHGNRMIAWSLALAMASLPTAQGGFAQERVKANRVVILSDDISNQTQKVEHSPQSPPDPSSDGRTPSGRSMFGGFTGRTGSSGTASPGSSTRSEPAGRRSDDSRANGTASPAATEGRHGETPAQSTVANRGGSPLPARSSGNGEQQKQQKDKNEKKEKKDNDNRGGQGKRQDARARAAAPGQQSKAARGSSNGSDASRGSKSQGRRP